MLNQRQEGSPVDDGVNLPCGVPCLLAHVCPRRVQVLLIVFPSTRRLWVAADVGVSAGRI